MIYAHVYPYRILADEAFKEFIISHRIVCTRKNSCECVAITDETEQIYRNASRLIPSFRVEQWDEHHFMTKEHYEKWKYGREYEIDRVIYHYGEPQESE